MHLLNITLIRESNLVCKKTEFYIITNLKSERLLNVDTILLYILTLPRINSFKIFSFFIM